MGAQTPARIVSVPPGHRDLSRLTYSELIAHSQELRKEAEQLLAELNEAETVSEPAETGDPLQSRGQASNCATARAPVSFPGEPSIGPAY